eukprot:c19921_g1_i3.p1 GENE.c19921_g1_i3~~c19921_g1_i3.p1  ORF type:complete len:236 (+),score=25.67 c19921_g1_i3:826-1533(+)
MTDTKLCTVAWRVALSSCFSLFARSNWPRSRASSGSSPSREAVRVRLIWVHCQLNPRAVVRGVVSAAAHVFGCIIGSWAALSWCLGGWPTPRGDKLLVLESLLGGTSPLSRRPPANARPPGPREGHMNCDNDILNVLAFRGVLGTSGLVGCGLFEEDAFVLLGLPMFDLAKVSTLSSCKSRAVTFRFEFAGQRSKHLVERRTARAATNPSVYRFIRAEREREKEKKKHNQMKWSH